MCSSEPREIEWVKQQLFRVGIRSQIRSNPVAQALRVTRLELWVEDDRDYLNASKLYASIKEQASEHARAPEFGFGRDKSSQTILEVQEVSNPTAQPDDSATTRQQPKPAGELNQATTLLEQEIENLLARETELGGKCAILENQVSELTQALAQCQEQLTSETATCAAAEKLVAELTASQRALQAEICELGLQLRAREEAVLAAEAKAEAFEQQLRGFAGNLGALCGRLHTKKPGDSRVQPPTSS